MLARTGPEQFQIREANAACLQLGRQSIDIFVRGAAFDKIGANEDAVYPGQGASKAG